MLNNIGLPGILLLLLLTIFLILFFWVLFKLFRLMVSLIELSIRKKHLEVDEMEQKKEKENA